MPSPPNDPRARAAELRRQADQLEAEAERREVLLTSVRSLRSRLASIGEDAADAAEIRRQLEAFLSEARRIVEDEGLPSTKESTNLDSMSSAQESSTPESRGFARGKGRTKGTKHPFVRALYARGLTVSAWAVANGVPKATAASWIATGPAARRITREWADKIAKLYGVPATAATWRNGITD